LSSGNSKIIPRQNRANQLLVRFNLLADRCLSAKMTRSVFIKAFGWDTAFIYFVNEQCSRKHPMFCARDKQRLMVVSAYLHVALIGIDKDSAFRTKHFTGIDTRI
jgi:hypothetical protein